jgi:hypothetical protein
MDLQVFLQKAKETEEEALRRKAAEREAQRERNAAALAEKRAALMGWLGELAGEFEVTAGQWVGEKTALWTIWPKTWRTDMTFGAQCRQGEWALLKPPQPYQKWGVFKPEEGKAVDSVEFGAFLLECQMAYEVALEKKLNELRGRLSLEGKQGVTDPDKAAEAHSLLMANAPEREVEWQRLYDDWQLWFAEIQADEEAYQTQYNAALEKWREAWERFLDERDAVNAANRAALAELQAQVNQPLHIHDIEYALVSHDDREMGPLVETRVVAGYAPGAVGKLSDTWTVIELGRAKIWTFRNIVRVGEKRTTFPLDDKWSDLFLRRPTPWGMVVFPEIYEEEVKAVIERLKARPWEPEWEDISGGLPGSNRVAAVRNRLTEARGEEE